MDEAVVVGYGTQKKKDLTASGKSINIKQIGDQPTSNVTQLLQGKVAGLAIGSSNTSRVRVRGINSNNLMDTLTATEKLDDVQVTAFNRVYRRMVTGSSTTQTSSALVASNQHHSAIRGIQTDDKPLFVVNNQIVDISLMKIDVDNVKSITVLKTKESIALYGSKGEKGAVLIETKAPVYYVNNIDKESYETYQENDFISAKNKPYSTFSIDVDNASYTNIRRFINHGQPIPKDAVRIEEMINFFKYNTPQPKNDHPYTINTEYGIAPWNPSHNILKVSLQGKTIIANQLPASNIVFLIDVSGSMDEPNKLPLLQASMKMLVGKMRAQDKVSIVTYAGNAGLVLPATSGAKKDTILHAIDKLSAGGSTAGAVGIELAYKIAKEQFIADGNNRVILATDGDFNVGVSSDSDLETLISEKRKSNIFLTCLGFGMGNY
ncbi:MAG: VWA domain-containing protein, partial [Pseudopedobacter saltans]